MDNSGRREAPITFFFLIEFCFIQDILPQGSPDRKVNNIRKGFLVIHRLWMSLLVVSSGIFFFEFTRQIQWICTFAEYFIWLLYLSVVSAMQVLLVCKSIYFAQQFNLFSSAIQFVFLGNSICFPRQFNLLCWAT